jgi:hypothetical protein
MYDWNQTPQTVTLSIPLSYKIDAKKIDSIIASNFIKLNITEMKMFKMIDLYDEIDLDSSSVVVEDRSIIFYLSKMKEEKWPNLEFKANSKEELKERRKIAEYILNERIKNQRETAANQTKVNQKFVVDKIMKIDEEKRVELKDKKSKEKNEAESELYNFISEIDGNQNDLVKKKYVSEDNEIFTNESIKVVNSKEKENISTNSNATRQPTNIKINLTEKQIPHFAARESLSKEPPYPKSKKYVPEKNYVK